MQPRVKINRAVMSVTDSINDYLGSTLVEAVTKGQLKIDDDQLPVLLNLIKQTVTAGYQRSNPSLMTTVDEALKEHLYDAGYTVPEKKD